MKKIGIAILLVGLLITGLWWTIRRRPGAVPPSEDNQMMFQVETAKRGYLIRYVDPQTPLRSLRWLVPVQSAFLVVQVVTQSDRQRVSIFKDGKFQGSYLVPKPTGVREGFFRLAELRDARVVDGDVAVLLYATPGTDELPLLVALDLKTKDIRWMHRARGEHLVMTEGAAAVIYLFGSNTPPVRLPIALVSKERTSPTGARSAAKTLELPPEILEIADLKPTGLWTFLLAHKGGLSAYLGSKGWLHQLPPEGNPGLFKEVQGVLTRGGKKLWWQPFPGMVVQILPNGTPQAIWTPEALPVSEPFAKDAALLHLLGADAEGKLWFDLAIPSQTTAPKVSTPPGQPAKSQGQPEIPTPGGATTLPSAVLEDWPTYVNQGLDRVYGWDPQKKTLQRVRWSALAVPQGFPKPANGLKIAPGSDALLLENGPSAWLLPLSTLALGEPTSTGQPTQAK